MSVPVYKGDSNFITLLKSIGSEKELPEIRAMIMSSIWALDFVQPSALLASVLPMSGTDQGTTEAFIGQFFALYNQLADHQDPANPFQLTILPKCTSYADLIIKIEHRQLELKQLVPLTYLKKEYASEKLIEAVAPLLDRFSTCVKDIGKLLKFVVKDANAQREFSTADNELTRIGKNIESVFNELGQLFTQARKAHMLVKDALGEDYYEPHAEKVGRNDPCPCGSGKKYKKCCLN